MKVMLIALVIVAGIVSSAGVARAEDRWLDAPLVSWNVPGAAVPAAPASDGFNDAFCGRTLRPAETAEDAAVQDAGWKLFSTYQGGWGVRVLWGLAGYDGMCRPIGFNAFVFVDGAFAGTIAPEPMASRFDGAANTVRILLGGTELTADFARYTDRDPLCCPSATSQVTYRIERTADGPVLVPTSVVTRPNGQE